MYLAYRPTADLLAGIVQAGIVQAGIVQAGIVQTGIGYVTTTQNSDTYFRITALEMHLQRMNSYRHYRSE